MKNTLLLLTLFIGLQTANSQYVTIPDANFKTYLKSQYPGCFNGSNMMDTTCSAVINEDTLIVSNKNIASIDGIQFFKNLKYLDCSQNQLTNLPKLSSTLTILYCSKNLLTTLPSLPSSLRFLYCYNNQLTSISNLPSSLTSLSCYNNQLTSLPSLPASLTSLSCYNNQLASLPSLPLSLTSLSCFYNQLSALPSLPTSLITLKCNNNQLASLPTLPSSISTLNCYSNRLTSLPSLPDALVVFRCDTNQLESLPILPADLQIIYCFNNRLTSLPVLPNSLEVLYCFNNQILALPALPNSLLQLACDSNKITALPTLPSLLYNLGCYNNSLTVLPALPSSLLYLYCDKNQLTSLPVLPNKLMELNCSKNRITSIASLSDSLKFFDCDSNLLTSLPTIPSKLKTLYCNNNAINCLPALPSDLSVLHIKSTNIVCLPNAISNTAVVDSILPVCTSACTYSSRFVYIPDSSFRNYLRSKYPSCFDTYGYMDSTCSLVVTEDTLKVNKKNIASLEGIQYFKTLKYLYCDTNRLAIMPNLSSTLVKLYCGNNQLTALPSLPGSLSYLDCYGNKLTSLPTLPNLITTLFCTANNLTALPALPSTLRSLACGSNQLTNLPTLPVALRTLSCANNQLTNLPVLPNSLTSLDCHNNKLTTLPSLSNSLTKLFCESNHLTTLPTLPETLTFLYCNDNKLTFLPALPSSLYSFGCSNNQLTSLSQLPNSIIEFDCGENLLTSLPKLPDYLQTLFTENNLLTQLPSLPNSITTLWCNDNSLNCLPILPFDLNELHVKNITASCMPNAINANAILDTILPICTNASDICEVNPFIQGKIYNDMNNNNKWDSIEPTISQQIVKVLPNNWLSASNVNGNYAVKLDTVISNTWSAINNFRYVTITPASYSLANIHDLGLIDTSYDFGVHIIPNVKDLETVFGSSPARPGFTTNVSVTANNVGTVNQSNITIKLKKPNGFTVLASSITPTSTINDTLIWKNISINYLEHQSINIQLQVPVNAVLGDNAVYEAWSNGTQSDTTPLDNYTKWIEVIRGSFDPNDKLVNKATLPPTYNANKDRLLYTIRFQNTGTDTAFTVIVRDAVLNNIDITSLRVVNASHNYQLIVREKNIVEVAFPNIQLPARTQNEAKSHGFVQLEFKPKAGLPVNAEINNTASIFFDYNSAVVTNTATTKVQLILGTASNRKLNFKLFPNPTSSSIKIELPYNGNGNWYLSDISGNRIKQNSIENNTDTFDIDVADVASGTYLLTLEMNGTISTSKVVIVR